MWRCRRSGTTWSGLHSYPRPPREGPSTTRRTRTDDGWNATRSRRWRVSVSLRKTQRVRRLSIFSAPTLTRPENYLLADDSWKYDIIPEIKDGKNIADFIDPDIAEKLEALEREEEQLEAQGFYASDEEEMLDSDEEEFRSTAREIEKKKAQMKLASQAKNRLQNRPVIPKKKKSVSLGQMTADMRAKGIDPSVLEKRAQRLVAANKAKWDAAEAASTSASAGGMDLDADDVDMASTAPSGSGSARTVKRSKALGILRGAGQEGKSNRQLAGLGTMGQSDKANELRNFAQREPNRLAKASESDRHVPITRPKWMLAGKRKGGKTDRR